MSATRAQISAGVTVQVGFPTGTITCMVRASQGEAATGNVEYVPDENGDDATAVVSNLGERLTAEGALLNGETAPEKGQVVTINSVKYLVEECSVARTATVARVSLTLYRNKANAWTTTT